MMCQHCKTRWADFPKEDYDFPPDPNNPGLILGIISKTKEAGEHRIAKYNSDEQQPCPTCLGELAAAHLHRLETDNYLARLGIHR